MKAIKQIIDYLRARGELTCGQLTELASQGLFPWHELYEEESAQGEAASRNVTEEVALAHESERELPTFDPVARKGRGRRPKAADLKGEVLCERLAEVFAAATSNLIGLIRLARPLAVCATWTEAAVVVRNAKINELEKAMEHGLQTRSLSLRQLWDFLAEEGYRTPVPEREMQGPIAWSYRALLAVADPTHLGRHATLLHYEEVQQLFNLRMAQRRVVRAWLALYERRPDLIGRVLQREEQWLAYWSMVILYTARRGSPGNRCQPAAHEDWPEWEIPDPGRLDRAWAHAAFMDPLAVIPLLHEHEKRSKNLWQTCQGLLEECRTTLTLPSSTREFLDLWCRRGNGTRINLPENAEARIHLENTLRPYFNRAGIYVFHPNSVDGRDPAIADFAVDLLKASEGEQGLLIRGLYPRCCFLCPRTWDRRCNR